MCKHQLFYSVYKFFEARNLYLYNTIEFPAQDNCARFVTQFREWFPDESAVATGAPGGK